MSLIKKRLSSLIFLPLLASSAYVKSEVKTSATGDNVTVHSEARTVVNGEETIITSDEPGEIKIEAEDDNVQVTTKTYPSPAEPTAASDNQTNPTPEPIKPPHSESFFNELNDFLINLYLKIIKIFQNFEEGEAESG